MDNIITQCRYLTSGALPALRGLDDGHLAIEPAPGAKTAGWLIGHLAVTGDYGRRLCGRSPRCPREWRPLFNPGSEPSHDPTVYPRMTALGEAFHDVYTDLCNALGEADAARLASMNPVESARAAFPTAGDFVVYLMTGHLGYHLGQLVGWRAAAGLGRLGRPATVID